MKASEKMQERAEWFNVLSNIDRKIEQFPFDGRLSDLVELNMEREGAVEALAELGVIVEDQDPEDIHPSLSGGK